MLDAQELSEDVVPAHGKGSGRSDTLSCCSNLSDENAGEGGVAGLHCIAGGIVELRCRLLGEESLEFFMMVPVLDSARRCHDGGLVTSGECCPSPS